MKGHLDYMRQMETILVAVGIPTKEVPGSSFVLPQPVTISKDLVDAPDKTQITQQLRETQSPVQQAETLMADIGEDSTRTTEIADGWDVPDISDLLDAITSDDNVSKSPSRDRDNVPPCQESDTNHRPVFNESEEQAEADDDHVSWSWDDPYWTAEHSHTQSGPKI